MSIMSFSAISEGMPATPANFNTRFQSLIDTFNGLTSSLSRDIAASSTLTSGEGQLGALINIVDNTAPGAVTLPDAANKTLCFVMNNSLSVLTVYSMVSNGMNSHTAASTFALTAGQEAVFFSSGSGWWSLKGA